MLGEIGGEDSLRALRQFAQSAGRLEQMVAEKAIAAIEARLAQAPSASPSAPKTPAATEATGPKTRTWRDSSGRFEIEATFAGFSAGKVVLQKKDGKRIAVPLERLSKEDQAYVEQQRPSPFE